jgi:F-type H+-transporting ATPase subunit epsilon
MSATDKVSDKIFQCKILTPEKSLFEGNADMVVVPGYDGEIGILKGHSNLVARLSCGECRIFHGNSVESFYVEGGVVKIRSYGSGENFQTEVVLLNNTSFSMKENKLNKETLEEDLKKAQDLKITDERSFEQRAMTIKSAQTKLKLLAKKSN